MIPVHELVPDALAAVLRRAPLSPEKVDFAWRMAVGPAIANATTVTLRDGVLAVRTRDVAWRREVERAADTIRPRLNALLGQRVVRAIQVDVG